MFQFFVEPGQITAQEAEITGGDVNHIRNVLRMKAGEQVRISDQQGQDFLCRIEKLEESRILLRIQEKCQGTEPPIKITLFQGLPKGDKMELVVQKGVELGVSEIVPVAMQNCVVKLNQKRAEHKRARWQAIAESAAKQSKRSLVPVVRPVCTFSEAAAYARELDVRLFPYEQERGMAHTREVLQKVKKGDSVGIFIGPEGGFSAGEVESIRHEMEIISLGNRILRTETAGLAGLAMLLYEVEE